MAENKEAPKAPSQNKTQLSAFGPCLPISGGTFDVKPWRMKEERALAGLRDSNKGANMAEYVSMILAYMLSAIKAYPSWEKAGQAERQIIVSQMPLGDVLYAYVYLRTICLGSELTTEMNCPRCHHKFSWYAHLDTVEVAHVKDQADSIIEYKLKNPFQIRDGKAVTGFKVGPPRWNSIETLKTGKKSGVGAARLQIIQASIQGVLGDPAVQSSPLSNEEMDNMTKMDIEGLSAVMNKHLPGPDMSITAECPKCDNEYTESIDWNVDNFFVTSSK